MAERRTLILMRHATAGHAATRDHDRPLTDHGRQEAADAGRWIRASLPPIGAVLCSTATRTRQTLAAAGIQAPVSYQDGLYGGGTEDILELLRRVPETADTVLVVGHAPGIPAAAAALAGIAREAGDAGMFPDPADDDAALAGDGGSADPDAGGGDQTDPGDGRAPAAVLHRFPAAAIAVLNTPAPWSDIADTGADLVTVRMPDS
jgi:phosphohistidine phosphatase